MKILILCTGNSCRSQMAEGILKSLDPDLEVYSAGTKPAPEVHPRAIQVMAEIHLDIREYRTKNVTAFLDQAFDYVITVCDDARETCPVFSGKVKNRLHLAFADPARATGSEAEITIAFRGARDEIAAAFRKFYDEKISG